MFLYETHLHTYPVSACSSASPEEMARWYKSEDYTGIIVTDHFFNGNTGCPQNLPWAQKVEFFVAGYERAKKEGEKIGLDVFFGLESSFEGTDFLVYGLDAAFLLKNPGFDKLKLPDFSAAVRNAGGYIAQAHPFRAAWWITDPRPAAPALIDGIEVYNASMPESVNKQAQYYAETHGLAKQSGSDAHDINVGRPGGVLIKKRAADIFDIIKSLKTGEAEVLNAS